MAKTEYPVTACTDFVITKQDIEDIIAGALSKNGIWHWCETVTTASKQSGAFDFLTERLTYGGTLWIYQKCQNYHLILTAKKLINGVRLWVESGKGFHAIKKGTLDCYSIYASDADEIVQYALFGRLLHPRVA